ncbi:hypothetical protein GQ44DRAFT_740652 [Phaeosphaeriaceae sp. PMI808]|nr:hypothetical protein GQ44DRAFT_740652 [Phaeosphaeriaceae sp. PMI808]
MSEFRSTLEPYKLEAALINDCDHDCLVIDVGRDGEGHSVASLDLVLEKVNHYVYHNPSLVFDAKKLYIIGGWNHSKSEAVADSDMQDKQKIPDGKLKWHEAIASIKILMGKMRNLQELTWVSQLPFTAALWEVLPLTLTKIVLDLGEPVRIEHNGEDLYKAYIAPEDITPLQLQTKLKELRLFRVRDSMQSIVWETIFRNTSDTGMLVLDIQMAVMPMVRSKQWLEANNVTGLNVPLEESEEMGYKGLDGRGVLHYSMGTGEYLDSYCIRKARIASGLEETTPLPLWCLKLDGFVIDNLPFEKELSRIILLTCGEKCIDGGLRAPKNPKTPQKYGSWAVNNTPSHCIIQWPNWTGIFEDHGHQHKEAGVIVDSGLSTPITEAARLLDAPLTTETLTTKDLDNALETIASEYFTNKTMFRKPSDTLEAPASTVASVNSPRHTEVDGSPTTATTSFTDPGVMPDNLSISDYPLSTIGSFEHINCQNSDSCADEEPPTANQASPNKSTFTHKVRRSWGWLSGSSS